MTAYKSPIDQMMEKHWLVLNYFNRRVLLADLGVGGRDESILGGKTMSEIVHSDGGSLPSEIRGRLIMALTEDSFTKEEYERARNEHIESNGRPPICCERGN